MKLVIAGGSGFIGTEMIKQLSGKHEIIVLTRNPAEIRVPSGCAVEVVKWDGASAGSWSTYIDGADAVINLSGASIGQRWTKSHKERILSSRVGTTKAIVEAIAKAVNKPAVLINMSGVGFYGDIPDGDVTETHPPGSDFLANVCQQWEGEALAAENYGVRVVTLRQGVVLGKNGGALGRMLLPFRMFIGGTLGSGKQWFPWIHIDDAVGIILYLAEHTTVSGPVNATAPQMVQMKEFCATIGKALHRPSWAPVPAFILSIVLGEMSAMILTGQKAVPHKIITAGYKFKHPNLLQALRSIE